MKSKGESEPVVNIIIAVFTIIIIIALSFLYYYYAIKNKSVAGVEIASLSGAFANNANQNNQDFTKVINFTAPNVLPEKIESGECKTNSIAQPYRVDALRCIVGDSVYDPCFTTFQENIVFCQMNPLKEDSFLIKLDENLPSGAISTETKDNWAWFVKLKDGTYCSPYTETRPIIGTQEAYYGCNSSVQGERVVLIGDLIKGDIWTADKATLTKGEEGWETKNLEKVKIDSVWQ